MPATKHTAENTSNKEQLEYILSVVFTAKNYIFILSFGIFLVICEFIPLLKQHHTIFLLCFLVLYTEIIFPSWFFQGLQKMKVVSYIQLGWKVLSIPFIFWLVQSPNDIVIYTAIVSSTSLLGGICAYIIIRFQYQLKLHWMNLTDIKPIIREALPFFYTSIAGTIKTYSIPIIMGSFFGMRDVAVYDLANKVRTVPRALLQSVNAAIFPKLITNINPVTIKKIIRVETYISLVIVLIIALISKYVILLMGGQDMSDAYPLTVLLSATIVSWLIVGAYLNFVFIPYKKAHHIPINQIIAASSFFIFCFGGLLVYNNILVIGAALSLSGLLEIVYCIYITKRERLL